MMSSLAEVTDWNGLALEKLSKVLGESKARETMESALQKTGLPTLRSADDLYHFAQELTAMPGFARAIGGMLSLQAVMRGAHPDQR
jgi:hypothetical protein